MSRSEAPDSLTPPPTQESAMADTPMLEAPATIVEHAPTTNDPVAATTDKADPRQGQQQYQQPGQQPQQQPQQSHPAGEPPPPPPETSPTTPSLRDPIPRQSTPRQHETPSSHDRVPPPLSSYPTAPNSLPRTPRPGMSAPSAPRAPTTDSIPHLYSYPTAPASAPQTPQQPTPQQGTSAAASLDSPAASPAPRITFDDYLSLSNLTFEWSDSYDSKDWKRLLAILAPTLMIDYTHVNGSHWPSLPAPTFVHTMSHLSFIGDPYVHTQHHIGASQYRKISATEAVGQHQLRAAHQRYERVGGGGGGGGGDGGGEGNGNGNGNGNGRRVVSKGQGYAVVVLWYRRVGGEGERGGEEGEGEWKVAGLRPVVRWNEVDVQGGGGVFGGF